MGPSEFHGRKNRSVIHPLSALGTQASLRGREGPPISPIVAQIIARILSAAAAYIVTRELIALVCESDLQVEPANYGQVCET